MRSFAEQGRLVRSIFYLLVSLALFAGLFILFFAPKFFAGSAVTASILGVPLMAKASDVITSSNAVMYGVLAGMVLLFIVLPIIVLARVIKHRRKKRVYANGLADVKFSQENQYIYESLLRFFKSANMVVKPGYDADEVFIRPHLHFASIRYMKRVMYVLLDRDYARRDKRVDRSGYIAIYHASDLQKAKDRIYEAYQRDFKPYVPQKKY